MCVSFRPLPTLGISIHFSRSFFSQLFSYPSFASLLNIKMQFHRVRQTSGPRTLDYRCGKHLSGCKARASIQETDPGSGKWKVVIPTEAPHTCTTYSPGQYLFKKLTEQSTPSHNHNQDQDLRAGAESAGDHAGGGDEVVADEDDSCSPDAEYSPYSPHKGKRPAFFASDIVAAAIAGYKDRSVTTSHMHAGVSRGYVVRIAACRLAYRDRLPRLRLRSIDPADMSTFSDCFVFARFFFCL
jgi:hypothetical protein